MHSPMIHLPLHFYFLFDLLNWIENKNKLTNMLKHIHMFIPISDYLTHHIASNGKKVTSRVIEIAFDLKTNNWTANETKQKS